MSHKSSQDASAMEPAQDGEAQQDRKRGGAGAASALERMKADLLLRFKRLHGPRASGPSFEDDQAPER